MATQSTPGDEIPSDQQSMMNFNDPQENELEGYSHGIEHAAPQDETVRQGNGRSLQDTAGNASPVVYFQGDVGLTERDAMEKSVREVNRCIDSERARYESAIRDLQARYNLVSTQLAEAREYQRATEEKLCTEREWLRTKDQQLCAKDQQLLAKDSELTTKSKEQSEKEQELKEREQHLVTRCKEQSDKEQELDDREEMLSAKEQEEKAKEADRKIMSARLEQLEEEKRDLEMQIENMKKEKLAVEEKYQQKIKALEEKGSQQIKLIADVGEQLQAYLINQLMKVLSKIPQNVPTSRSNNGNAEVIPPLEPIPPAMATPPSTQEDSDKVSIAAKEVIFWKSRELGTGAFGKVYEGRFGGIPCAVKILNEVAMKLRADLPLSDGNYEQKAKRSFEREGECLTQLNHRNVVKLYDIRAYPEAGYPVLVMEKLDGTLTKLLESCKVDIPPVIQLSFSCDIASALQYLQDRGIIHRDLCSDNILLERKDTAFPVMKVSDFGMSKILNFEQMSATLSIQGHRMAYYPPEMRDDPEAYDKSIDLFMFGVVMTQIVCRRPLINSVKLRKEIISKLSESNIMKKYIMCCVQEEQKKRPSAKMLHSVLTSEYEMLRKRILILHGQQGYKYNN